MAIIVQKYGGSSVGDAEKIKKQLEDGGATVEVK